MKLLPHFRCCIKKNSLSVSTFPLVPIPHLLPPPCPQQQLIPRKKVFRRKMLLPNAFLYLVLRHICSNSSYRISSRLRMRGRRQAKSRAAVRFLARFRNPRRGCKMANLTKRWNFTQELLKRRDKGWSIQLRRAHALGREQEKDQIQYYFFQ